MEKILKKLGILMLLLTVLTTFSCSDNDDDTPAWQALAGEYTGWTSGKFAYSPTPLATDGEKLTVVVADGKMNIQLVSAQWGTATVNDVAVTTTADGFSLSGTGSATLGMSGSTAKAYDCTLTGTISKDRKTANVVLTYPAVMGGTTVTFALGEAPAAQLVAGSYKGWSSAKFAYSPNPMNTDGEKVAVTANEDGTINVTFTSTQWGTATIENAKVEKTADGFSLSGQGKATMGMNGSSSDYDCTLEGTIGKDKDEYSLVFKVPAVMGGLNITFAQGSAPSAE